MDPERVRLAEDRRAWLQWGPYVSERAWGTVREDYSADGDAWGWFPHDHARSRAYRWSEDGLGGVCDDRQTVCLAFAFWNGRDPILKERIFGLTGPEGNHGEDAKEYWWYLDSTPTHSWMRWRYMYPQAEFPYGDLVIENGRRGRHEPEYELIDTGVFDDDRFWEITADYAKASPHDLCIRLRVRNAGPDVAAIDVLPTVWFRNTWAWGRDQRRPMLSADDGSIVAQHHALGRWRLRGDDDPELLFCDNESNARRLWDTTGVSPYPKDGINDHVVHGATTVNPGQEGTKAALRYHLTVEGGATAEVRLRWSAASSGVDDTWSAALRDREAEADVFYAAITPSTASADEALVLRQALAGMLWGKQFFHYDVERWLDGDVGQPPPPIVRQQGRNADWRHLNNHDVISMPDPWEYPWYAAWDLAFHCVALAHVDATFAKEQLLLLCREWFMHPNGQLPAYEWSFGDVNPPVHVWAALRVFHIDGASDYEFLERLLHKLLLNFTWWVNRKDADGNNVFEGGFLGLDNIGPLDRSANFPVAGRLEQSDGTAWMAGYCLCLLEMALTLARHDQTYEDLATKFFEHFTYIATAMYRRGLWNEDDGFYYDVFQVTGGERIPMRVRSAVGLLPLCATTTLNGERLATLRDFEARCQWFIEHKPEFTANAVHATSLDAEHRRLLSIVGPDRLRRILATMLDEREFLSPFGLRALSQRHRDEPFVLHIGDFTAAVGYEPAESETPLFGGNSNWRGPIWFPTNYLLIEALDRFAAFVGDAFTIEHPTGSGTYLPLRAIADELAGRLVAIFVDDAAGHRPVFGAVTRLQDDPAWHDLIPFFEYFHGDTGAGLGASHQTGWTGLVADLIIRRHQRDRPPPRDADG